MNKNAKKDISLFLSLILLLNLVLFELTPLVALAASGEDKIYYMETDGDIKESAEWDNVKILAFLDPSDESEVGLEALSVSDISLVEGVTLKANEVYIDSTSTLDNGELEGTFINKLNVLGNIEASKITIKGDVNVSGSIKADNIICEQGNLNVNGGNISGNVTLNDSAFIMDEDGSIDGIITVNDNSLVINKSTSVKGIIFNYAFDYSNIAVGGDNIDEVGSSEEESNAIVVGYETYLENNTESEIELNYESNSFYLSPNAKGTVKFDPETAMTIDMGDCFTGSYPNKTVSFKNDSVFEVMYAVTIPEDSIFDMTLKSEDIGYEGEEGEYEYFVNSGQTLSFDIKLKDDYKKTGKASSKVSVLMYTNLSDMEPIECVLTVNASVYLPTPENPYSLSGTKGKGDYYISDVILEPKDGYKVSFNEDGSEAKDSITFSEKKDNVKIYLVDLNGNFTKGIDVGTINPNVVEKEEVEEVEEVEEEPKLKLKKGSGSLSVSKCYYGGKYEVKASSSTNDTRNIDIKYISKLTGNYLPSAPSGVGTYIAQVTLPSNEEYESVTLTKEFSIEYLPVPVTPYTISGKTGEEGYYLTDVTINSPEGYLIAESLNGTYTESIKFDKSNSNKRIYLKKTDTGEMTDAVYLSNLKIDKDKPQIIGAKASETYYSDSLKINVKDDNLVSVSLDGKDVEIKEGECEMIIEPNGDEAEYEVTTKDEAGNVSVVKFKVCAEWLKDKVIVPDKSLKLRSKEEYTLPEGQWKISVENGEEDPNVYSGNGKIKVNADTRITFTKIN